MVACTCNPRYSGGWGRRITWTRGGRDCSELRSYHCTAAWATEQDSISINQRVRALLPNLRRSPKLGRNGFSTHLCSQMNRLCPCLKRINCLRWQVIVALKVYSKLGTVAHTCNPSYSGGWGRRITWTWEAEVAVSQDYGTVLQPGRQSQTLSQKKKKEKFRTLCLWLLSTM